MLSVKQKNIVSSQRLDALVVELGSTHKCIESGVVCTWQEPFHCKFLEISCTTQSRNISQNISGNVGPPQTVGAVGL